MNFALKLKHLTNLTASEQSLVDYILASPEKVIRYSPKELAEHSFVSISTIYRLINKLDLDGLNDLKLALVNDLNEHSSMNIIDIDYPISSEDNNYAIMRNLESVYEQTVQSTIDSNALDSLSKNTKLLYEASSIALYTTAANIYFAKNFQFQMQEIGRDILVPVDDYSQNLTAANTTSSDLAIIISYEGRGTNVKKIMQILKKNQCKIILITSKTSPLLKENVDGLFLFPSLENHYNKISSFSTRTSLLYLLDAFYLSYFNQNYDHHLAYKLANYQKLNPELR
ncbi:MurR/RpiR family transcriptional regulator [Enterococcus sp. LJL99]